MSDPKWELYGAESPQALQQSSRLPEFWRSVGELVIGVTSGGAIAHKLFGLSAHVPRYTGDFVLGFATKDPSEQSTLAVASVAVVGAMWAGAHAVGQIISSSGHSENFDSHLRRRVAGHRASKVAPRRAAKTPLLQKLRINLTRTPQTTDAARTLQA